MTDAYTKFDNRMSNLITPFFNKGWIDAGVKPGKAPGAFAHPTVTDVHPYIMLNYLGKPRDVMTLAHELGHGVHQVLASSQGQMLSSTPLTLAETASVFGEMLTFQKMLDQATNKTERKVLLANKVEDMINESPNVLVKEREIPITIFDIDELGLSPRELCKLLLLSGEVLDQADVPESLRFGIWVFVLPGLSSLLSEYFH